MRRSNRDVLGLLMKNRCFLRCFLFLRCLARLAGGPGQDKGRRVKETDSQPYLHSGGCPRLWRPRMLRPNTVLKTPHLDRMAAEGIRFTRHYTVYTVCVPSRCVLMTGLHTGHARIRGNVHGLLTAKDFTVATLLQQAGYKIGCFGKWGAAIRRLGMSQPARL